MTVSKVVSLAPVGTKIVSKIVEFIWLALARTGFVILLVALVAKIFGCPALWTNYIFWTGMVCLGITSLMLVPYLDKDFK